MTCCKSPDRQEVHPSLIPSNRCNEVPCVREIAATRAMPAGKLARYCYQHLNLFRAARHPPLRAAFLPIVKETVLVAVIAYLVAKAGPGISKALGKPLHVQAMEMLRLWFQKSIDPPSYYALELYRDGNFEKADGYLTRYETKNGLMITLNTLRKGAWGGKEMNDKSVFAEVCESQKLPHSPTLAYVADGLVNWIVPRNEVNCDLFCKKRKGMGAKGCMTFRNTGPGTFSDESGVVMGLDDVEKRLIEASLKSPLIAQRWLKNHGSIADLARDSLLSFRVISCMNERGEPEVCLAMLRLLSVLEPDWLHLPDGEYAAPVDLVTGELGLLTGDSIDTSLVRFDVHPVNKVQVKGRVVALWPMIRDLALRAQAVFKHRVTIGWDIALTPDGPILIEGNTNYDVMFLQRVHDAPAAASRLGEILSFHLHEVLACRANA